MSQLITTIEEADAAFAEFLGSDRTLAFDTETTGLQVRNRVDVPRTIQFSWRPWKTAVVFEVTDQWMPVIRKYFEAADAVIGHNVKFDIHAIANKGIEVYDYVNWNKVHDTMWGARLYDERTSAKLKDLAVRYIDHEAADAQRELKNLMRKHGWDWASVPVKYLVEYGGNDAIITGRLFDFFVSRIQYAEEAYEREQRLSPILYRMERVGLYIDHDMLDDQTERYTEQVVEAGNRIEELVPGLNPRSPIQLKGAFRNRGLDLENTQAATLKMVDDELAQAIVTYRESHKTLSTYLVPWRELTEPTGRLHPWFNQLGTKTGRFSSSDPNLQNITRGHVLRDIFAAEQGNKILVADWNQMELRLYAHFAEDENMRAAFLSGDDIYQQAADLLGVPRQVGKMIMLASIYGAGVRRLKEQCIYMSTQFGMYELIPELESYDWPELYDRFHNTYKIKALARQCELAARRRWDIGDPHIRTVGGRRQRPKLLVKRVNGRDQKIAIFKDLANSLVQGSSADLMKQALIDVDVAGLGDYLRLTVHDEMVLEVPKGEIVNAAETVKAVMHNDLFIPPLTVNVSVADRYGEAK